MLKKYDYKGAIYIYIVYVYMCIYIASGKLR